MCVGLRSLVLRLGLLWLLVSLVPPSSAQDSAARISRIQANLNNTKQAFDQLPDQVKKASQSMRRLAQLSGVVNSMASRLAKEPKSGWQPTDGWDQGGADENGLVQVNNPARDNRFSPFLGFTQNDSVTARCGDSVVVVFQDSGSTLETLISGQGGVSFTGTVATGTGGISLTGYATSRDGGQSFRDRGAVPPGPDVDTTLAGKPSVACADRNNFYLAQTAGVSSGTDGLGHISPKSAIVLSRSSDGGTTWSDPVTVVVGDNSLGLNIFDDPWVAVDPSNPKRVYISYIHQNFGAGAPCGMLSLVEVISSTDGGQTFSPNPLVLDSQCFATNGFIDVGTRMAISSQGRVSVAWEGETLFEGLFEQVIEVSSFSAGGPATPVIVDAVFQGGAQVDEASNGFGGFLEDGFIIFGTPALQGGFENQRGFDLAVDHSGGPTDGFVYLVWDDSRNAFGAAPELEDDFGVYSFTDILLAVSADGGQTFAPTRQVNSDLQTLLTRGHDHFRPVVAVDSKGKVAACWYDRRNDPQNYQFERFCSESTNSGTDWAEFRVPGSLSNPVTQQDLLINAVDMGQNDNLTTDFQGSAPGFIGGIQWTNSGMNPDVKEIRFR